MSPARRILLVNGPNLNMLGTRQPEIYGSDTLADVERVVLDAAAAHGLSVDAVQSNHEGVLIDRIHEARTTHAGIVINAGGLTHTSVALRDALVAAELPVAEVHISDIRARESFRHVSLIEDVALVHVIGEGVPGYARAVHLLAEVLAGLAEG